MTKQAQFFQTALELIHEKGFKAMTIRDLAKALSCDPANIYNYVRSKADLLDQLLFEISAEFHRGIDEILQSGLIPPQQIEELIRQHVDLSAQRPLQVGLLVNEWRNLKDSRITEFVGERNAYEQKVQEILRQGIRTKHFRDFDPELICFTVLGCLRWQHSYNLRSQIEYQNPLRVREEIRRFVLPGLLR